MIYQILRFKITANIYYLFSITFYSSLFNLLGWHDTNCSMTSLTASDMLISQWMCNIKKECSVSCPIDDLSLVAFVDDIRSISLAMLNSSQNRRWRCLSLIHSTRSVYVMNSGFSLSQDIQFCPQLKCIQVGVKGTQTVLYTSLKSLLVEPFVYTVGSGVENLEVILPKHSANCLVIVSCLIALVKSLRLSFLSG